MEAKEGFCPNQYWEWRTNHCGPSFVAGGYGNFRETRHPHRRSRQGPGRRGPNASNVGVERGRKVAVWSGKTPGPCNQLRIVAWPLGTAFCAQLLACKGLFAGLLSKKITVGISGVKRNCELGSNQIPCAPLKWRPTRFGRRAAAERKCRFSRRCQPRRRWPDPAYTGRGLPARRRPWSGSPSPRSRGQQK